MVDKNKDIDVLYSIYPEGSWDELVIYCKFNNPFKTGDLANPAVDIETSRQRMYAKLKRVQSK